tara:strand:- start:40479 stop:41234 length:756 start_codon:yes stop_codon:yes gene_type:complete
MEIVGYMKVIPAIDIKQGKCVRLKEGDFQRETVFSDNPQEVAEKWFSQGAEILHIVDLDGAISGRPMNQDIICNIAKRFSHKIIQVGGGIRNLENAQSYLNTGVSRIILGTSAIEDRVFLSKISNKFPQRIILGLDARNGQLQTEGWLKESTLTPDSILEEIKDLPLASIIYTDISKDGTMQGPDISTTIKLAKQSKHPLIASGGVATLENIKDFVEAEVKVAGIICGRALYEEVFTVTEAIDLIDNYVSS